MTSQNFSSVPLKDTVNLPKTNFDIRANLSTVEPALLKKWADQNLYSQWSAQKTDKTFVLHDGPPYPNGNIHMGHALNKILKDIINRFRRMSGAKTPYVPGWDCHGLPIETQVLKELQSTAAEQAVHSDKNPVDIAAFRDRCKTFADGYVDLQRDDFKRLGILGRWEKPYLTLNPGYEAQVIYLLGKMAENGLVYRGRKPIHWCTHCETALAEAEIEYADHRSPSVFVAFHIDQASSALKSIVHDNPVSILVWTTTPWTLPANVAIAGHADFEYDVLSTSKGLLVAVHDLVPSLIESCQLENVVCLGSVKGKDLVGTVAKHPFLDRQSPLILADFVTASDGTGFVHIAPGHGQDDYRVGLQHNLPIVMPVDSKGCFTQEVEWAGMPVFEANKAIGQRLEELGRLLALKFIKHSYPHCWRCKNPVIFRATEQWFIAMDKPMNMNGKTLRQAALEAIKQTKWYPAWGQNRIYAMVENRPDWCISRQRLWGIPIPAFTCKKCGHAELTGVFNEAAVKAIQNDGTQIWFKTQASDLLPSHAQCSQCGHNEFNKEHDILDVWFESGASFGAVLQADPELSWPADLYLEGSDQHRGWFHSALLIAVGAYGKAPYKAVLTHGFLVDEKGKKMSKSQGNVIAPQKVIEDYGADVLRWWIAGTDFKDDISISANILNQSRDSYSKVRNTIRFCLSNLFDFEVSEHSNLIDFESKELQFEAIDDLDKWAMFKLQQLVARCVYHYDIYEFHTVTHALHDFCAVTLSSQYLDMVKDRLYCDIPNSPRRRSTQAVLYTIANTLIRLSAPILAFTSEDAYTHIKPNPQNSEDSIHLQAMVQTQPKWVSPQMESAWALRFKVRELIYKKLEELRNQKLIKSFLEASVVIHVPELQFKDELYSVSFEDNEIMFSPIHPFELFNEWESFFIVAQVRLEKAHSSHLSVEVSRTTFEKCERCWRYTPLNTNKLCSRCEGVLACR